MAETKVCAEIAGNVWKVLVAVGDRVEADQPVAILESMKMEIPVESPATGTVAEVLIAPSARIDEGQLLLRIEVG